MSTVAETIRTFLYYGNDARTPGDTLRAVHPSRFYTYAFSVDTTPPPAGEALPDDVAWSWDPTRGVNQHPEHCGKCSPNPHTGIKYDSPLDYRLRIGHTSERAAVEWSSVYTSGAGLLYSRGLLIAARQAIGGRDGRVAVMVRSARGLDTMQRRHLAELRAEVARMRKARASWDGGPNLIVVGADALRDYEQGPRWACTVLRQDGGAEAHDVNAWNRDAAWNALRKLCVSLMDDGEPRCPQSVALRPTSAAVDALRVFVPEVVTG